jgi:hypothetical protein
MNVKKKQKRKFRIPFIPIFVNIVKDRKRRLAFTILLSLLFFLWFYNSYLALTIVEIGKNENFVKDKISVIPPKTIPANLTYYQYNFLTNTTLTQWKGYYGEFKAITGEWGYWIPYALLFGFTIFFFLLYRQFEISRDLILLLIAGFDTALIILTLAYFINPIWAIIGITLSLVYIVYRVIQERREEID